MKLYLMRHGEATHPATDARVPLNARGRGDVLRMAEHFKTIPVRFDAVWYSPKARAEETARVVAEALRLNEDCLQPHEDLVPEASLDSARKRIEAAAAEGRLENLLIVSHLPFLPALLLTLSAGVSGSVGFETAEVRCCVYENQLWKVEWSRRP